MKKNVGIALVLAGLLLGGCAVAPQQSVLLAPGTVSSKTVRIGVAMTTLPKVDTHLPGAGCLLCIAAASIANSSLTTHTNTLTYEDIPNLKKDIANLIRKKGGNAVVIEEPVALDKLPDFSVKGPNIARKDFTGFKQRHSIDKLVVIQINAIGMWRTYSAYFPTSDPKATVQGMGYLVNLDTNGYEWYEPVMVLKAADKAWDEPPKFPGLTNAYFQAIEIGKDSFLKPFN
jgi:hypothetical protein